MARLELAPEIQDDFDRILEHLAQCSRPASLGAITDSEA